MSARTPLDVLTWMRSQTRPVSVSQIAASMGWSEGDVVDAITALIVLNVPVAPCGSRDGVPLWEYMG